MKRNRKPRVKGMTLVEIIIAIAVLAVIGMIMVRIGTLSNNFLQNSFRVNRKTTIEAPVAAAANPGSTYVTPQTEGADADGNVGLTVTRGGKAINIKAKRYTTSVPATNEDAQTSANMDLDFLDVDLTIKTGDNIWEEPTTETTP